MATQAKVLINGGYPLHTFEQFEEKYREYIFDKGDIANIHKA